MGLSTAQARLLTITARKSDCEFQSMSFSHQKIALSRDMEKISTEYQNALNQTKLVYDYYGTNTSQMDLSYGLLMSPSVYNDYYPKLVTDAKNRVVLNSSYAAAAKAAGIPAEGLSGTPSSDVRNAFIEALAGENVISTGKATTIQGITYNNAIGNGSTTNITTSTTDVTYDELLNLLKAKSTDTLSYGLTLGQGNNGYGGNERLNISHSDGSSEEIEKGDGTSNYQLNLSDLLSGDTNYTLAIHSRKGEKIPLTGAYYLQEKIVGSSENSTSFLNWMTAQFTNVLGGTAQSNQALQYAYNAIYDMVYADNKISDIYNEHVANNSINDKKGNLKNWCNSRNSDIKNAMDIIGTGDKINKSNKYYENKVVGSKDYLGFRYTYDYDHSGLQADRNDKSQISINLNNLAQVFLTAYVEYIEGVDNTSYSYNVGAKSNANLYDGTKDDNFKFTIVTGSETSDSDTCVEASFYDTLFNRICLNGWTENDQVEDASYMQEMMKSGLLYISSISDDGYYYQGNYSTDKYISEVTDDEAISKAEAKYNTEKTKIENKEDTIDMKMKNLDTEISSLTTEYDTTKSIISKSIEKSFKRYDA